MSLYVFEGKKHLRKRKLFLPVIMGLSFLVLSVTVYQSGNSNGWISFGMGLLACMTIVMFMTGMYEDRKQSVFFGFFAKFTMPIFVMHTLFAAPFRALLLKMGIYSAVIHVILGIAISFIGPIIAAWIMKKSKWLEFFLYPGKFVKIKCTLGNSVKEQSKINSGSLLRQGGTKIDNF